VDISHIDDALLIQGGSISGASVEAHGDHRIAMALAVASLKADHPVTIAGCESVSKSYPDFFKDLATIGAIMRNQPAGDE
jgi:3-phosphoshikimate 1-carboxyvinyltransferase